MVLETSLLGSCWSYLPVIDFWPLNLSILVSHSCFFPIFMFNLCSLAIDAIFDSLLEFMKIGACVWHVENMCHYSVTTTSIINRWCLTNMALEFFIYDQDTCINSVFLMRSQSLIDPEHWKSHLREKCFELLWFHHDTTNHL